MKSAINQARSDLQDLHKQIDAATAKDHAMTRALFEKASVEAQRIAASMKTLADAQRADAKQHLKDAAARLEEAAKGMRDTASASEAELRAKNKDLLDRTRVALRSVSRAIAAQRPSISKN